MYKDILKNEFISFYKGIRDLSVKYKDSDFGKYDLKDYLIIYKLLE